MVVWKKVRIASTLRNKRKIKKSWSGSFRFLFYDRCLLDMLRSYSFVPFMGLRTIFASFGLSHNFFVFISSKDANHLINTPMPCDPLQRTHRVLQLAQGLVESSVRRSSYLSGTKGFQLANILHKREGINHPLIK